MRECPEWFQRELARIGGRNPYGDPIFKLVWSPTERRTVGGRFHDGYVGYREMRGVPGAPCWCLMVWEPREVQGSYERWLYDYRDPETGLLDCGRYPIHGRYRALQRFIHNEIVHGQMTTFRMEPCGLMLDLMLPMLMRWRRLSDQAKVAALQQEEQLEKDRFLAKAKDARAGCRISRGSQLVQKRAEIIESGFRQAMAMAAHTGLGMRVE
jgi:hypothetical protein